MRWFLLLHCLGGSAARRQEGQRTWKLTSQSDGMDGEKVTRTHPVHLLLIRNGPSCATLARPFGTKFGAGLGSMEDPLLASVGESGSLEGGEAVEAWLTVNNLTLDAVLSSSSARSLQTALQMFPKFQDPVFVVPYIDAGRLNKVFGTEAKNTGRGPSLQVEALKEVMGNRVHLDYRWSDAMGVPPGTGQSDLKRFMNFLQHIFLPSLVEESELPSGEPIVVAVVTHLNVIQAARQKCPCQQCKNVADNAQNNQVLVVDLVYQEAASTGFDVTPAFTISPGAESVCQAHNSYFKGTYREIPAKLCYNDVGSKCFNEIQKNRWPIPGGSISEVLIESSIVNAGRQIIQDLRVLEKLIGQLSKAEREIMASVHMMHVTTDQPALDLLETKLEKKRQIQSKVEGIVVKANEIKEFMKVPCWDTSAQKNVKAFLEQWPTRDIGKIPLILEFINEMPWKLRGETLGPNLLDVPTDLMPGPLPWEVVTDDGTHPQ